MLSEIQANKPIKFAHLWKLANQSTLNKAHVIKIAKSSCTVTFRKARNSLVIRCREECVSWRKKQKMVKIFKASANEFWITLKSCSWFNKVDHGRPSIKWPQWKGNDMLLLNAHPLSLYLYIYYPALLNKSLNSGYTHCRWYKFLIRAWSV